MSCMCRRALVALLLTMVLAACGGGEPGGGVDVAPDGPADTLGDWNVLEDTDQDTVFAPEDALDAGPDIEDAVPDTTDATDTTDAGWDGDLQADEFDTQEGCKEPPFGFGCPCEENSDCLTPFCLHDGNEKVCSKLCVEECPPGWQCTGVPRYGPDLWFVCVPLHTNLCRPCETNADCDLPGDLGGWCLAAQDGSGSFCTAPCHWGDDDCPSWHSCQEFDPGTGETEWGCMPDDGECECNNLAIEEAAATTCSLSNEHGTCLGSRYCAPVGLTPCDAATPVEEICDYLDNDCDGETDEGFPIDCLDDDLDDDLIPDSEDNCPLNYNPDQADLDGDGIGDVCDVDIDGDGVLNDDDNCPLNYNPDQTDWDDDGLGDACDEDPPPNDADGDGVPDDEDCAPLDGNVYQGAEEICWNEVDENCNDELNEGCALGAVRVHTPSAVVSMGTAWTGGAKFGAAAGMGVAGIAPGDGFTIHAGLMTSAGY